MTTDTALAELRRMAAEAGFDEARPELEPLWTAVQAWSALPVEGVPDRVHEMFLFECSLFLERRPPESMGPGFVVSFTRQFSFNDAAGDYIGMEHVTIDLTYAVHDDFRAIAEMADWNPRFGTADQLWGDGRDGAGRWAEGVEATRSYRTALRHRPLRALLDHTPV